MTDPHRPAIEAVLNPGEKLEWSGGPDQAVMRKTLGKRRRRFPFVELGIVAIIGWVLFNQFGDIEWSGFSGALPGMASEKLQSSVDWDNSYLWLLIFPVVAGGIVFLNRRQAQDHIENLSYGITDQRVLIVKKGKIYESWTPSELREYVMNERVGAKGHYDIIWDRRRVDTSGDSTPSALELETARVGFKALPDGPAVLAQLDAWRKKHDRAADREAKAVVSDDAAEAGVLERLRHPTLGFSLERPTSWTTQVRRKKVIFGKFGVDMTTDKWYAPHRDSDWNVILTKDATNSEVMLEVAETAPTVSLDAMTNSRALKMFARDAKIFDQQDDLEIGGLKGFGFSLRLPDRYRHMITSPGQVQTVPRDRDHESRIVLRQVVLHDGRYQYYLRAIWNEANALQEKACRRILQSLIRAGGP